MFDGLAAFGILAWLAYIAGRVLARRNVPELVAFLIVGALAGPSGFELISEVDLARIRPVTEISLAVLMFVIGERVSTRALRQNRWAATAGIVQYALSAFAVFVAARALDSSRSTALILAALAGAGAPMTIAHVISSRRASGEYAEGLIGTHAVSDALATTTFAAILPVATLLATTDPNTSEAIFDFVQLGIGGFALGIALGWLIARLGIQIETSGELLLFVLVHILVSWSVADRLDISLPLAALVGGAVASSISATDFSQRLFRTLRTIEQPLYLLFFALAGASIHLSDLPEVGKLGVAYIVVRTVTKIAGAAIGGPIGGLTFKRSLRLGVNLIPQAGVAVGLAVIAAETLPADGAEASTIVLGSVVLFELVGPILVARGLDAEQRAEPEERVVDPGVRDRLPEKILVASPIETALPDWVIDMAKRWEAELVALLPGDVDEGSAADLRGKATKADIELRLVPLRQESFTGATVRLQAEVGADLLILFAPRPAGEPSRLALFPAERIARQVTCPVLTFPLSTDEAQPSIASPGEDQFARIRRFLSRDKPQ